MVTCAAVLFEFDDLVAVLGGVDSPRSAVDFARVVLCTAAMAMVCWFPRVSAMLVWLSVPVSLYVGTIGLLPIAGVLVCAVATASTTVAFLSSNATVLLAAVVAVAAKWSAAREPVFWIGAFLLAAAVGLGLVIRAVLRSSAERRRQDEVITQVREQAERARREERLRLAHEMHDYVAHELTVSVAALAAALADPRAAEHRTGSDRTVLRTVEASSRRALDELRQALRVLEDDAVRPVGPGIRPPTTAAAPTLASLIEAAAQDLRLVGDRVQVSVPAQGGPGMEDDLLDLLRRFLTEGVTNVVKYGGRGSEVVIAADVAPRTITVTIDNTVARGPASGGSTGLGLPGLSAEAQQRGGRITCGPRPGDPGLWRLGLVAPLDVEAV